MGHLLQHNLRKQGVKAIGNRVQTFSFLFGKQRSLVSGRVLHAHLIKIGISLERSLAVKLLLFYLNSGNFSEAEIIINNDLEPVDIVVQNCLVSAYFQWGMPNNARSLFDKMPERDVITWTAMVSGLMKYGMVEEAMRHFLTNPCRSVVYWTAAISGLVQNGWNWEALTIFSKLLQSRISPNAVTFTSVLRACVGSRNFGFAMNVVSLIIKIGLEQDLSVNNSLITLNHRMGEFHLAKRVFSNMIQRDAISWTAIMDMYVEMGNLTEARRVFDEMPERNEVSWGAMISRYGQHGHSEEALALFCRMVRSGFLPSVRCFASCLSAVADLMILTSGMTIRGLSLKIGFEIDVHIRSSLIDLYCKCGDPETGKRVFDSMAERPTPLWNSMIGGYNNNGWLKEAEKLFALIPSKNAVSWNTMIAGYVMNAEHEMAFRLFRAMLGSPETPNKESFSSVLCACAHTASLGRGRSLHGRIIKHHFLQLDTFVGTSLSDMYAKSGDVRSSFKVFDRMPVKNEISWTVMIQGFAENGEAGNAVDLFDEMTTNSSIVPNEPILASVLFACSHRGLVEKGFRYFNSMKGVYGIEPGSRHYTCMVDLLARSGMLVEAEEMITTMPFKADVNSWAALLSGCKTYKNEEIAERAAKRLWELSENQHSGFHVLLSNVYANAGRWSDVTRVRKMMRNGDLGKDGGCSWIEMKDHVCSFYSFDSRNSSSIEIFHMMGFLRSQMLDIHPEGSVF